MAQKKIKIQDIIALQEQGLSNAQIATRLGCSQSNISHRIATYWGKRERSRPRAFEISLSDSGFARLSEEAEKRGLTVDTLVTNLLSVACFGGSSGATMISTILDD